MAAKIAETLAMILCGAVLGALAGLFVFFAFFVLKEFPLYTAAGALLLVVIFGLARLLKRNELTLIGIVFTAIKWTFVLTGIAGMIYFFSEEGNYDDFDMYLMIASALVLVPVFSFFVPLRMVWHETRLAKRFSGIFVGAKALVRSRVD